jgi:hypothetical protein
MVQAPELHGFSSFSYMHKMAAIQAASYGEKLSEASINKLSTGSCDHPQEPVESAAGRFTG